jgi:hypothetical protein
VVKALMAEWYEKAKAVRAADPSAPLPKPPMSAGEFNAIVQAQRHLLAYENVRQGKPGDIQQHNVAVINLIDFLRGGQGNLADG